MKTSARLCLIAIGATTIAGCLGAHPVALGAAANAGPVTCDTNCTTAWERTQLWMVKHSRWKVQTATDVLVQTYNPPDNDPSYGFTATKEPIGGGRYTIALQLHCANFIRCDPARSDVLAAFNHYVATGEDVLLTAKHGSAVL
jgi:hypothetical protein